MTTSDIRDLVHIINKNMQLYKARILFMTSKNIICKWTIINQNIFYSCRTKQNDNELYYNNIYIIIIFLYIYSYIYLLV